MASTRKDSSLDFYYHSANSRTLVKIYFPENYGGETGIEFSGKGNFYKTECFLENVIIDCIFEIFNFENSKELDEIKQWRTSFINEITIPRTQIKYSMHKGITTFIFPHDIYDKFSEIMEKFFKKNFEYISFDSDKEKRKIEEFFCFEFPKPIKPEEITNPTEDEIAEIASFKKIITDHLELYAHSGNKFFIFINDPQRNNVILDIQKKLNPILDKPKLTESDKLLILTTLAQAKTEAENSHRSASQMGSWGITESRLANQLNNCINDLINNGLIKNNNNSSFEKKV